MKNKFKMEEPYLKVAITQSTKEHLDKYNEGNLRSSSSANSSGPRSFQKALVLNSFDLEKYPKDSEWMIGDAPGQEVNFFGERITIITDLNLYERIK